MDELTKARKKINEIDEQMSKLFEQRMKTSKEVAEYKIKHSLPIYDEKREKNEKKGPQKIKRSHNSIFEIYCIFTQPFRNFW